MNETPLASLIVVTYNSVDLLPAFFAALATTRDAPYEVIVVDKASQDWRQDLDHARAQKVVRSCRLCSSPALAA
jgi:GT2 family glycosyltransferase